MLRATIALALLGPVLAGCLAPDAVRDSASYASKGFDGTTWPDLHGAKVRVLAYSAYSTAFAEHAKAFANLTNGTAELLVADDAGSALHRAVLEKEKPTFDVLYGIDNALLGKAIREGVFAPYKPVLSHRIDPSLVLSDRWEATPVSHGYIAVNVDAKSGVSAASLDDVKTHASRFVTEHPGLSTPGLGFLIATVATYGEKDPARYDYLDYWNDLFTRGALVAPDWTVAYEQHFSGGYGQFTGGKADRALVTSYTTSPAYEMYYEYDTLNGNVLAPKATFHQIQTVGIVKGAAHRAAAEAWVEFTLTSAFQNRTAELEAIYPVVGGASTSGVFAGRDPPPGSFVSAPFTWKELEAGTPRWVREWTDAYERFRAG